MQSDTYSKEKKLTYQGGSCVHVVQHQGQTGWHPLRNLQYIAGHSDGYRVVVPLTMSQCKFH